MAEHAGERIDGLGAPAPALLMAALAMLFSGAAQPAEAPAATPAEAQAATPAPASAEAAPTATAAPPLRWPIPIVRIGGVLEYGVRRDDFGDKERVQNALSFTLKLSTNTYLWEPWFARVYANLGLTLSKEHSNAYQFDGKQSSGSRGVGATGDARVSVLAQSRYPFEAHIDRSDSRVAAEQTLPNGYASARYGFTQHYLRDEGDSMLGWDRNTQSSAVNGRDRQDRAQLTLSHNAGPHRLQLLGDGARNTHEDSGDSTAQKNMSLQHSYAPAPSISVENMLNISRSGYHLQQGESQTGLVQLSSLAFWRPKQHNLTVTGGVRLFALGIDTVGVAANDNALGAKVRNGNANLGASYELSEAARLVASANLNVAENQGVRTRNASESVGASYQPAGIELGALRYNWSGAAAGSNRSGGPEAGQQLSLQLNHNLGRMLPLASGATMQMEANQGLSALSGTSRVAGGGTSARQLTHGGSWSWNLAQDSGSAMVRLSASDARSLDGRREFFQMVNLQAFSNLASGAFSSWSGSLTIQAVRQGFVAPAGPAPTVLPEPGFVPASSGAISYQNQRLFGVRHLRFSSDLRLNGQALLPLLGSPRDQETAAWDNRLDYLVGRTHLRLGAMVSRSSALNNGLGPVLVRAAPATKTNRSIMFSLSRGFGDF
jgi:hypothetical protein